MPTRLIVDGSMSDTITFYETFPTEPTVNPNRDLAVRLPIDQADRLQPITLLALLTRMEALPAEERELLLISHGTDQGLSIRLVAGTDIRASADVLHLLRVVGGAVTEVRRINGLPAAEQAEQWERLVGGLRYRDGTAMFPAMQRQTAAVYRQMFEYFLNRTAGQAATLPTTNPPLNVWEPTQLPGVGRRNLDDLLARGNAMRGRFDRLDLRGCKIGANTSTLQAIRAYFGCRVVVAPDVIAFDGIMPVDLSPRFDQDFDNNVDQTTRQALFDRRGNAIRGRQPVQLNQAGQEEMLTLTTMPRTRRFDATASRAGDEVFIRLWATSIVDNAGNPHHTFFGWLRAIAAAHVESFVLDKVSADVSHWTRRTRLPLVGLWLISDLGASLAQSAPIVINTSGDPLAGIDQPPPPPPPAFALPREPEYRRHLISDPSPTP